MSNICINCKIKISAKSKYCDDCWLELKNQKSPKKISEDLARHQYYGKNKDTI